MRLLVFAYQSVGHGCLERLLELGDDCVGVVTHRDRPDEEIWFPSVAKLARGAGIPVRIAEDFAPGELLRWTRELAPDGIYSFYYRQLLSTRVLEIARQGAYNMHGSLLPRYRGRCPANWVILNEEKSTGVTLHHMSARADAGDIVGQREIPISPRETALSLYQKMVPVAADVLQEVHPQIRSGTAPRIPQDESRASTFGGRRPEDGEIEWTVAASRVDALVRAVTHPFPGAFTHARERRLTIWESRPLDDSFGGKPGEVVSGQGSALRVACGEGSLEIVRGCWEGASEVEGSDLTRGIPRRCRQLGGAGRAAEGIEVGREPTESELS